MTEKDQQHYQKQFIERLRAVNYQANFILSSKHLASLL